jgi:cell division protein FtsL
MGVFEMVVLLVFIATVGKVADSLISRPGATLDAESKVRLTNLEAQLQASDTRVAQAEEKVAELEEKLRFLENLLAKPERPGRLYGGGAES